MKSKTFFRRTLSLFLAILMFTSVVPAGTITAQASTKYYWNHNDIGDSLIFTTKSKIGWFAKLFVIESDETPYLEFKEGLKNAGYTQVFCDTEFSLYKQNKKGKWILEATIGQGDIEDDKRYKLKNETTYKLVLENVSLQDSIFDDNIYSIRTVFNRCENFEYTTSISSVSKNTGYYIQKANASVGSLYYNSQNGSGVASNKQVGTQTVISTSVQLKSNPSSSAGSITTILQNTKLAVTKISGNYGYVNYNGICGWVNLNYCAYAGPIVTKPEAPTVTLSTSAKIPVGGLITVNWNDVYDAKYYSCSYYDSSGNVVKTFNDIYGTSCSYSPDKTGTYTVKVTAHNSLYSSDPGTLATPINAIDTSTVTYLNDDGTIIATQKVAYCQNATAPVAPEKKGYTFKSWNGSLTNITQDTSVTAEYTINKYIVQFVDYDGKVIDTQTITYGEDATPPSSDVVPLPEDGDYVFAGWDSTKYLDVYNENKSDPIVINALYEWNNKELPITCKVTSASRQPDGYYVYFDLTNYPDAITRGRAVVALKTTSGKLVYMTESAAFSIPAGGTKSSMEVFVPCETAATVAEVIIVDSYSSGIPISAMQSSSIEQGLMWSKWLDELPTDIDLSDAEVESRQEYRFRDKEYTTASTKTKSGWTYYNTTSSVGTWSAWQDNVITKFNYENMSRDVATRLVDVKSTRTLYNYYHYYNTSTGRWSPVQYSGFSGPHSISLTYALSWKSNSSVSGYSYYGSCGCGSCGAQNMWVYSGTSQQEYVSGSKTQYRYLDTYYTHHFYKWDDTKWSEWNTTPITATSDRQVEEKTTYRYKSISAGIEDTTGVQRKITTAEDTTFVGEQIVVDKLDTAYAGKNITLFISKYNASSDFTNEYVAQSTVGEDGSFAFDYVLREEPTVETGDYVITIGIEGTTCMQQIGVIEAPKAQYTVTFVDYDGTVISEQTVTEGENALIPEEIPARDGYTFVGWNNNCTNIQSDLEISPIYSEDIYTVVYIDWRNETFETQTYKYGEPLIAPDFEDCDSGYAVGWDVAIDGETVVTSNMVITAVYDTKTFTVDFYDYEGNVVDSQTIEYDGVAEIPELPEDDGVVYYDWDITEEDVMNVKENIAVFPSYEFEETTATPTTSVTTGAYYSAQTVELSCETEDALIYYTLDGTDPTSNPEALLYTGSFEISNSCTLLYYASSLGKNDSGIAVENYVVNGNGYLVTIENSDEDTEFAGDFIAESMSDIDSTEFETDGYTFEGFYYDAECTQPVDLENDDFDTVVTLYSKYTINSYNVKFLDTEGNVISEQTVEYLGSAIAPEMADNGDYIFCGWENGDFEFVCEDMEISAVYKHKDEIVTLTFDRNTYTMDEGDRFTINTTISDNGSDLSLVWISDDESIATVDETGAVSAVGTGTTKIYAVTEDDSATAECEVIVNLSPNYSICLKDLSTLGVDDLGYLREIPLTNNTVDNILTQLRNTPSTLTFTNASGVEITGSGLVGTGTVITLKNGDEVLDTMMAVMTGDLTCDGYINNRDIAYSARVLLSKENAEEHQLLAMDANGDGKVNNRDVALLARYLVGKETL